MKEYFVFVYDTGHCVHSMAVDAARFKTPTFTAIAFADMAMWQYAASVFATSSHDANELAAEYGRAELELRNLFKKRSLMR